MATNYMYLEADELIVSRYVHEIISSITNLQIADKDCFGL